MPRDEPAVRMKLVIQRVRRARVTIDGEEAASIGPGAVVLVGVANGDTEADIEYLVRKTSQLRIYNDEEGRLNAPIDRGAGAFLVVSQFTLYGDCRKGNRPSYIEAAAPDDARRMYQAFADRLAEAGYRVQTGVFQEHMMVELENDGPVTIILESRGR